MKIHYVKILEFEGYSKKSNKDFTITVPTPLKYNATAILTNNAENFFLHIDRTRAFVESIFFEKNLENSVNTKIRSFNEGLESNAAKKRSIYLVLSCRDEIPAPSFNARRDLNEFSVSLGDVTADDIKSRFHESTQIITASALLSFDRHPYRKYLVAGTACYLTEANSSRPIYLLQIGNTSHIGAYIGTPATERLKRRIKRVAEKIGGNKIKNYIRLFNQSHNKSNDNLLEFVTIWSSFEEFVNSSFKDEYGDKWQSYFRTRRRYLSKDIILRLEEIARYGTYYLSHKFLIVGLFLDPRRALSDEVKISKINNIRNIVFHAFREQELPAEEMQELLAHYLRKHFMRRRNLV